MKHERKPLNQLAMVGHLKRRDTRAQALKQRATNRSRMSGKRAPETGALRCGVSKGDTQEADAAPSEDDGHPSPINQ